ncbi:hypothetical protein [Streptomyces sp. NPDC048496]|uniref:hypothetical protein n=1 Tax=Streptomyces sp. NPDC048496 TaxID=3365558 RepID=UPI0037141631
MPVGDVSGNGLFRAQDLWVPGGSLSVGRRRRLALARLPARPADLPLDEPVNHVVLGPVRELKKSPGAAAGVLGVSHDRLCGAVSPAAYSGRLSGQLLE